MTEPSQTESNGRGPGGKFTTGNRCALGNPNARRVAAIRRALFASIKPGDLKAAVAELVKQAKGGDRLALAELLDRTLGRPVQSDLLMRVEELERLVEERLREHSL